MIATFISCSKKAVPDVLEGMVVKRFAGGKPADPYLSPTPLLGYSCIFVM